MRYIICYIPPSNSPLWRQGSRWLGRDALSGQALPQPRFWDIEPDNLAGLTRIPAHYGFHAPLAAPFRLKEGVNEEALLEAVTDFSTRQRPLPLPSLAVAEVEHFFCLRPVRHSPALQVLASLCTRGFDRFRAPLNPSELARCKAALLSGQEKKNLEIWGSPYVFDQFRFHFTLTNRLVEGRRKERVHGALIEIFSSLLNIPLMIDALYLFVEPGPGQPMCCRHRFPFTVPTPEPEPEPEERLNDDQQLLHQNLYSGHQCRFA